MKNDDDMNFLTDEQFSAEYGVSIPAALARLSDLAAQVERHVDAGDLDLAELLRTEGLELAQALDNNEDFFLLKPVQ